MKYTITILILFLPVLSMAQTGKLKTDTAVINELISTWTVGLPEERDEPVNIRVFNNFKNLFLPDALVYDDINAVYNPASLDDPAPYKTQAKTVATYAHDLSLQFKNLKIDSIYNISYQRNGNSDSVIWVTLIKKISGEKYRQYVIEDIPSLVDSLINFKTEKFHIERAKENEQRIIDTIEYRFNNYSNKIYLFEATNKLRIKLVKFNDTIRISSISNESTIIRAHCANDNDNDGIIDVEDGCSKTAGDLTARGCPDNDLDGVPNAEDACNDIYGGRGNSGCPIDYFTSNINLAAFVGVQMNSVNLSMPVLDQLGYNSVDFNESKQGSLTNPNLIISPAVGADFTYFFGKRKKNIGVSGGITYTSFTAAYEINDSAVYTFLANDGVNDYRRRITWRSGSTEELQYGIVNLPLLFRYRMVVGKSKSFDTPHRWDIEFAIGPSYMLFNTTSKYNANIDFEGLYQIDSINHNFTYTDYFDNSSSWNVLLTANGINGQSSSPGADSVFTALSDAAAGYDFASDKNYSGETKNADRGGFALNARFDANYKLDARGTFAFKLGANAVVAPLPDQSTGYQLINKTTDPYNSIYNAQQKSTYFSIGLHAGIVWQW